MTLKSYLRMLLAAVTLLFVTSGCNDDDDKVGPPSYSFSVAVSDVAQTEATVTVTPSNDQATYYYAAVKKAEFDTFESDAAYAQHILDNLKAIADKKVLPLSEYLATALVKGSAPQKITDLTAGTDYYAVALGMLTDGRFTSDLVKEAFKTDDAPEPELVISKAGGYFFGTSFGAFDNFTFWMSEDTVTEDMMDFTGEGTYLLFDLNVAVTGKATLPAGTFPVASGADAEENTIAPGADYGGGMMTGSAIVKINSDGTKNYLYIDGGALIVEGAGSSYVITAKVTSGGKEYEFKYEGGVSIYDTTGGGGDFELSIDVTNITATTATVNVTSSDETSSYYFDLFDEEDYQGYGGTPEGIAEFISDLLGYYQSQYPSMTLPQILSQIVSVGNDSYDFDGLTPGMKYYTFAIGVDATTGATTTTAVVKEFTTQAGSGGDGPELSIVMTPGLNGANTDTRMTVDLKVSGKPAVAGKYMLNLTSAFEAAIAEGASYDEIIEAYGTEFTAEELTELNSAQGTQGWYWDKRTPETSYTAVAKVYDADGNSTLKHEVKSTTASQGGGDGPELTLTMRAGDTKGENLATAVTCVIKSSGATAAKAGIWAKSLVDEVLAEGETIESIINNEQLGQSFEGEYLAAINGAGLSYFNDKASPSTEYIAIAKVTDAAGNSTIKSATATTESAGEASDAYKAWLGTWTVTSTSSQVNKAPVAFDVVFAQKVANVSYAISGWGIDALRDDAELMPTAKFDSAAGGITIQNDQFLANNGGTTPGKINFAANVAYKGSYAWVSGTGFNGLSGSLSADKQTATITCGVANIEGIGELPVNGMEVILWGNDGKTYSFGPAAGYTKGDYPIGPYTMTKKSSSSAQPASKSTAHNATLRYAGKLSNVLSVNAAVSVPAKQDAVVVESKVAMSESLVFEPSMIVCKGADNCNLSVTKKSLGLKKHYRK
jgi:hypothetical protein